MPQLALLTPPVLQITETTSNPARRKMPSGILAAFRNPQQKARPIFR